MQTPDIVPLIFAFIALVVGVGLLFVRIDSNRLRTSAHSIPGLALFRFRAYRYGAAFVCLAVAALCIASWAGIV